MDFTMYEAPYRFYAPNPGRWHSPDPLGGNITNPQSLNRYAYGVNNPTTSTDPLGLQSPPVCANIPNAPANWCEASYGGPPPNGNPECWTAWCMSPNGMWVWNEPNPIGSETAAEEALYNQGVTESFLMGCMAARKCGGSTTIGGKTYTWVSSYVIIPAPPGSGADFILKDTSHWEVTSGIGSTLSGAWSALSAFIAGTLAPMANPQRVAEAAKTVFQRVRPTTPKPPTEIPGTAPELGDSFMARIFSLMSKWLRGGGLIPPGGALPPSFIPMLIPSPCLSPSFHHLPACGALAMPPGGEY